MSQTDRLARGLVLPRRSGACVRLYTVVHTCATCRGLKGTIRIAFALNNNG